MPNADPSGLRILVVEDNPDCAQSTAMLLRAYGHHPKIAKDAPAALKATEAHPPHVVLLDISLPGMDGWVLAKRIKEQNGETQPFLIAITGWGREEDRHHSEESGIDLHLTKPVDPEGLRGLLDAISERV